MKTAHCEGVMNEFMFLCSREEGYTSATEPPIRLAVSKVVQRSEMA